MFPPTPEELETAATKQAEFLMGILGGPGIYMEKYGHPRMRARHLPFAIDEAARQEWLRCFHQAFESCEGWGLSTADQQDLLVWIEGFSGWMVNRKEARGA
jgi:hemoglobin